MGSSAVANTSRASTTLRRLPALIAVTASATACSQRGPGRLPSLHWSASGSLSAVPPSGQPEGGVSPGSVTVVSQARPRPSRPRITRGTMRTEPSEDASKVKVPNATGPEPRSRTWSSTSAASNTERSHFSPAANLSSPAGSVTRTASPQPARPAPWCTQATTAGWGRRSRRFPGSGTVTVRTASRPVPRCPRDLWRLSTCVLPCQPRVSSVSLGHPPRTQILGGVPDCPAFRVGPSLRRDRVRAVLWPAGTRQGARPPDVASDIQRERGHEHRPDDERVEQDAQRDGEPDLGELHQWRRGQAGERAGQHQARRGDDAAGRGQAGERAAPGPGPDRLLPHPG